MVELSIMSPTETDRRHFLIFSDEEMNLSKVNSVILNSGYHQSDTDRNQYLADQSRLIIFPINSETNGKLLGGFITPSTNIGNRFAKQAERIKTLGNFFQIAFIAWLLEWIVAFLVYSVVPPILMTILAVLIPLTFFIFLGAAAVFAIIYFRFEKRASLENQKVAEDTLDRIIPAFNSAYTDLKLKKIDIVTRMGERYIRNQLPQDFVWIIEKHGEYEIDERFWEMTT